MYKDVIDALRAAPHYGVSERVEIAKGKHELVTGWRVFWRKLKRVRHGRNRVL